MELCSQPRRSSATGLRLVDYARIHFICVFYLTKSLINSIKEEKHELFIKLTIRKRITVYTLVWCPHNDPPVLFIAQGAFSFSGTAFSLWILSRIINLTSSEVFFYRINTFVDPLLTYIYNIQLSTLYVIGSK